MTRNEILTKVENNFDNLEILDMIDYLLGVVINDIDFMNDLSIEEDNYDLGNNYNIKNEDLESIVSAKETIKDIVYYNSK